MNHGSHEFICNKIESLSSLKATLELLNKTTEDYFFVCDICENKVWYFSDFYQNFNIIPDKDGSISLKKLTSIIHSLDIDTFRLAFDDMRKGKTDLYNAEFRLMNRDNNYIWTNCKGVSLKIDHTTFIIGKLSHRELSHMFNPLTGLFNHFRLMADLKEMYKSDISGYLMMLNIDELSAINLNHGRNYGNALLKSIGSFIEDLPKVSAVYHNERSYFTFVIDANTQDEVTEIYTSVRNAVKDKCTVSAGVVPLNKEFFSDENSLYDYAKLLLYKAKDYGINSLLFFEEDEFHKVISSSSILDEMQAGVGRDCEGFSLLYQPQLLSNVYSLYGAECLLRYTSKSGKKVFPDEFIPLLESSKLIIPVGMWVLKTALNQCKEWQKFIPNMHISVNFSMVQLRSETIVDDIYDALKESGVMGEYLTIEITESIPVHEMDMVVSIIRKLKKGGIQVAIDDFGTGYSNLGYLNRFDVNEIKIDRMFIKDIDRSTHNCDILSQTIELAKKNATRVCCEGLETTKELNVIEMYSPNLLQGYLFDKPLTAEEFTKRYFDRKSTEYTDRESFVNGLSESRSNTSTIHFNHKDILRDTNMGLWVMHRKNINGSIELFFDETMESIMGLKEKLTPDECYQFWHSRIREDYVEYVDENFDLMTSLDKVVQLEYPWNHPTLGEVIVRSNGKLTDESGDTYIIEGYHRIFSNIKEA